MDKILSTILEDQTNLSFSIAIVSIFLIVFIFHFFGKRQKLVSIAPNLLISIGVLGTFFGIFEGLSEFNNENNNISGGVEGLLEGMQTAFVTSICGMFFGTLLRVIIGVFPPIRTNRSAKTSEEFMGLVDDISASVAGIRQDSKNSHEAVISELKHFAEQVSKNSTEAIIKSLEQVVREFNEQINAQFGDNFKQLNEAVGKLLEWQDSYKEQVILMQEQFQRSLDSIGEVEKAMISIKENTQAIPPAMEKLPEIVKTATDSLEAFAIMRNQAISAFPVIEENLTKLTSGLENQVQAFQATLRVQQDNYKQLEESYNGLGGKTQEAMDNLSNQMQTAITTSMEEIKESMRQNFTQFDKEAEVGIQRIGDLLGSVIDAIVEDYLPIAQRLRERLDSVKGRGDN